MAVSKHRIRLWVALTTESVHYSGQPVKFPIPFTLQMKMNPRGENGFLHKDTGPRQLTFISWDETNQLNSN